MHHNLAPAIQEAKTLVALLATEVLQTAVDGACVSGASRLRSIHALSVLKLAVAKAENEQVVDVALVEEAKTILVTQPLRKAIERRDEAELRAAVVAAEGKANADGQVLKVRFILRSYTTKSFMS